jgi:hypothetical protein
MKSIVIGIIISLILTPVTVLSLEGGFIENSEPGTICEPKDDSEPVSSLFAEPSIILWPNNIYWQPSIWVYWNGTDGYDGSGIQYFDVQYKAIYIGQNYHTMEIPFWCDWVMNTTNTSAQFIPSHDYIYFFRCRAVDNSNNAEPWPATWDSLSIVISVPYWICTEISDRIIDRIEVIDIPEHYSDRIKEELPLPEEDELPPFSRVEPLFPIHLWLSPSYWAQDQIITIQIYPYPPVYYLYDWLLEQGIISEGHTCASIPVSWYGWDIDNCSGIKCFDVQYRNPSIEWWAISEEFWMGLNVPGGTSNDWIDMQSNTNLTTEIFRAYSSGLYQFRCRATDNFDNVEEYPLNADASVLVIDLRVTETY